ncbi:hypothetical protein KAW38_01925 [Candidatus Micrarchaeota archaeon]|nr:hypothetical protein [Candidatus Micrarchaeota archaeon]
MTEKILLYTTGEGTEIYILPGKKTESKYDFIVKYKTKGKGKRERTPKHIHLIVEMYVKYAHAPELTIKLRNQLLEVFDKLQPINYYPPRLQVFKKGDEKVFAGLNKVGEFSVEFLLVVTELIMIQEKTNYPKGSLTKKLYTDFGERDRFSVVNTATRGKA